MCEKKGIECEPVKGEFVKRAMDVQQKLQDGEFDHEDLALYTIQLSAAVQHKRSILKGADFKDVRKRVVANYPECKEGDIRKQTMETLPDEMLSFMVENHDSHWKVEWIYKGRYMVTKSDIYLKRYGSNLTSRKDLYTKIIDTMGFSRWDVGYKMWVESIRRSGQIVKYEGQSYHLDTKKTCFQTAKMMTIIFDYQHLITMTLIK